MGADVAVEFEDLDREALSRVAAGDADAFAPLVERNQERLLHLCERFLGDREEARDAAQEVFLKAYRKAGSFRPRGQVSTWLYRIATNHCLNKLRRRKIIRFFSLTSAGAEEEEGWLPEPSDPGPGPERFLEARHRWSHTRGVIDSLPASQRSVLVLAKFEGLSYRQIANVLEITEGAVESRLFRAMQKLQWSARTASREESRKASSGEGRGGPGKAASPAGIAGTKERGTEADR